ncbi:MAG: hypothetical protein F6J93_18080 [Oscillatoria sp. SIO1A7]|nr:hypothetical protein [Oscillatoria sp. SIO1A7]
MSPLVFPDDTNYIAVSGQLSAVSLSVKVLPIQAKEHFDSCPRPSVGNAIFLYRGDRDPTGVFSNLPAPPNVLSTEIAGEDSRGI